MALTWLLLFSITAYCLGESINITGKIILTGNEPFTKIVLRQTEKSKRTFVLTGPLLNELENLQGATVQLKGTITGIEPLTQAQLLEVKEYQLKFIGEGENQKKPWVGFLEIKEKQIYLKTLKGNFYSLEGPTIPELKKFPGAKVWLTGSLKKRWVFGKSTIIPDAYGIIKISL